MLLWCRDCLRVPYSSLPSWALYRRRAFPHGFVWMAQGRCKHIQIFLYFFLIKCDFILAPLTAAFIWNLKLVWQSSVNGLNGWEVGFILITQVQIPNETLILLWPGQKGRCTPGVWTLNPWVCIWAFRALLVTSYLSVLAYGPLFIWTFWPLPSHKLPVSAGLRAIVYMDILALAKSQVTFAYKVSGSFSSFWFCMLANPAKEIGPERFDVLKWLGYNLQLTRTFGDEQLLLLGPVRSKAKSLDSYGSLKRR